MHRGKDIIVIKKPSKGKTMWYFYYYYTDDGINFHPSGRYSTKVEVDPINEEKSKRKAHRAARHIKYQKEIERQDTQTTETFSAYTKDWFIWGKCPYTTAEERRGRKLDRDYIEISRRNFENYILPEFKDRKIKEITTGEIESWFTKLQEKGLSNRTINVYYTPLLLIFREAHRLKHINSNPCSDVRPLIDKVKLRTILTMDEYRKLFKGNAFHEIWNDQLIFYTLTFIAASCGLRGGELQALMNKYVDLEKLEIGIFHTWKRKRKVVGDPKGTKKQRQAVGDEEVVGRIIPITEEIAGYLRKCHRLNPSGYIFSTTNGKKPVDHKSIRKYWMRALSKIGIDAQEYKARGLTFHSFRHFANSYFNDHFEQNLTMQIIGHTTKQMNQHYDHVTEDRLKRIREAMDNMGSEEQVDLELKESTSEYPAKPSGTSIEDSESATTTKIIWTGKSPEKQIEKLLQYWHDRRLVDMGGKSISAFREEHFQHSDTTPSECGYIHWRGNQNTLVAYMMKLHDKSLIEYKDQGEISFLAPFLVSHFLWLNKTGSYESIKEGNVETYKGTVESKEELKFKSERSFGKQIDRIINEVHSIYLLGE